MAQRSVLHLFFNQKYFGLVRGYLAEKIFHRGCITEKRLRTTDLGYHSDFHVSSWTSLFYLDLFKKLFSVE